MVAPESKFTTANYIQIGLILFGIVGGWFAMRGEISALATAVERHERKLELIDDVNARLIRIEEKVDQLRSTTRIVKKRP
jgi:hypothetical protein